MNVLSQPRAASVPTGAAAFFRTMAAIVAWYARRRGNVLLAVLAAGAAAGLVRVGNPFVAWAAGLLVLGMFSYKFFCRYLCPFGGALALLGRVRMLDWIKRRGECGAPCQTCRHRCGYGAISAGGKVDYDECFQCMDCVVIYESDSLCAPRIFEKKRGRTVPIMQAAAK